MALIGVEGAPSAFRATLEILVGIFPIFSPPSALYGLVSRYDLTPGFRGFCELRETERTVAFCPLFSPTLRGMFWQRSAVTSYSGVLD